MFSQEEKAEFEALYSEYEFIDTLGAGGMGSVILARSRNLDEYVAVKRLITSIPVANTKEYSERLKREAKVLFKFDHPNILRVFNLLSPDQHPAVVMEYIDGPTLRGLLKFRQGKTPEALAEARAFQLRVRQMMIPVAHALQYAHDRGVVHRDLKPSNILVRARDGVVKICDFGIARLQEQGGDAVEHLTATGARIGTLHYMSPEQIDTNRPFDYRSDIYAFGVMLYEFLTGRVPYADKSSDFQIQHAHVAEPPPPIDAARFGIPLELSDFVVRCLAKEAGDRPQSGAELAAALDELLPAPPGGGFPPIPVSAFTARLSGADTLLSPAKTQPGPNVTEAPTLVTPPTNTGARSSQPSPDETIAATPDFRPRNVAPAGGDVPIPDLHPGGATGYVTTDLERERREGTAQRRDSSRMLLYTMVGVSVFGLIAVAAVVGLGLAGIISLSFLQPRVVVPPTIDTVSAGNALRTLPWDEQPADFEATFRLGGIPDAGAIDVAVVAPETGEPWRGPGDARFEWTASAAPEREEYTVRIVYPPSLPPLDRDDPNRRAALILTYQDGDAFARSDTLPVLQVESFPTVEMIGGLARRKAGETATFEFSAPTSQVVEPFAVRFRVDGGRAGTDYEVVGQPGISALPDGAFTAELAPARPEVTVTLSLLRQPPEGVLVVQLLHDAGDPYEIIGVDSHRIEVLERTGPQFASSVETRELFEGQEGRLTISLTDLGDEPADTRFSVQVQAIGDSLSISPDTATLAGPGSPAAFTIAAGQPRFASEQASVRILVERDGQRVADLTEPVAILRAPRLALDTTPPTESSAGEEWTLRVVRDPAEPSDVSVPISAVGAVTLGGLQDGMLVIPAGQREASIPVTPVEPGEYGISFGTPVAPALWRDGVPPDLRLAAVAPAVDPPVLRITAPVSSASERAVSRGEVSVRVIVAESRVTEPITVPFRVTTDNPAREARLPGSPLEFTPGETEKLLTLQATDTSTYEGTSLHRVELEAGAGYRIAADARAVEVTITDDEAATALRLGAATPMEGQVGARVELRATGAPPPSGQVGARVRVSATGDPGPFAVRFAPATGRTVDLDPENGTYTLPTLAMPAPAGTADQLLGVIEAELADAPATGGEVRVSFSLDEVPAHAGIVPRASPATVAVALPEGGMDPGNWEVIHAFWSHVDEHRLGAATLRQVADIREADRIHDRRQGLAGELEEALRDICQEQGIAARADDLLDGRTDALDALMDACWDDVVDEVSRGYDRLSDAQKQVVREVFTAMTSQRDIERAASLNAQVAGPSRQVSDGWIYAARHGTMARALHLYLALAYNAYLDGDSARAHRMTLAGQGRFRMLPGSQSELFREMHFYFTARDAEGRGPVWGRTGNIPPPVAHLAMENGQVLDAELLALDEVHALVQYGSRGLFGRDDRYYTAEFYRLGGPAAAPRYELARRSVLALDGQAPRRFASLRDGWIAIATEGHKLVLADAGGESGAIEQTIDFALEGREIADLAFVPDRNEIHVLFTIDKGRFPAFVAYGWDPGASLSEEFVTDSIAGGPRGDIKSPTKLVFAGTQGEYGRRDSPRRYLVNHDNGSTLLELQGRAVSSQGARTLFDRWRNEVDATADAYSGLYILEKNNQLAIRSTAQGGVANDRPLPPPAGRSTAEVIEADAWGNLLLVYDRTGKPALEVRGQEPPLFGDERFAALVTYLRERLAD